MTRKLLLVLACGFVLGVSCGDAGNGTGGQSAAATGSGATSATGAAQSGATTSSGSGATTTTGMTGSGGGATATGAGGSTSDTSSATSGGSTAGGDAGGAEGTGQGGMNGGDEPYANVTAVSVTGSAQSYTFNVSVESADVDCTQYADWWEVLREDGSLVYRRILEHSHTDENGTSDPDAPGNTFTRSGGPVDVAENETVVVVAHMSVGGYDGMVMRGSVLEGFATAPDMDAEFAAGVENDEPQPAGCLF
ncbi:MAG TPA: hypothetical protein VF989_14620 [Polyangiaceae bacterium]